MLIEASIAIFLPETELELYGVTLKMYTTEGDKYMCIFGQPYEWPIPSTHVHEGDTPPGIHGFILDWIFVFTNTTCMISCWCAS